MRVNEKRVRKIIEEIKPAKLVAATKYIDEEEIERLDACGCHIFGENRVQAFLKKYEAYQGQGSWHFIGTLQTNKVKYIIDKVDLIHSINSYKLINEVEKQAAKHDKIMDVLLQVNIAHEKSKHGFDESEMMDVMDYISSKPHIHVKGLMMMAPDIDAPETRQYFRATKTLQMLLKATYPKHDLDELSMGMTNDYHVALEEGSTMVRLGRALYEED